jgi:hypothetical protein
MTESSAANARQSAWRASRSSSAVFQRGRPERRQSGGAALREEDDEQPADP